MAKKEEILQLLDSWEVLPVTIEEFCKHPESFDILMDIALNSTDPKSWRAAWAADKVHGQMPGLIVPYIELIINSLEALVSHSKKRHFLKLLSMNKIPEHYYGFLVDYCINVLTSSKEPPAVRVHAMQVLYNISEKESGMQAEIIHIIEHEMEYHATAAIISRGSRLLKKLRAAQQ
ncbi:hypothetical protein MNBD_BACTEROID01-110 [hydrothermal vent metagenome]|uniref:Uncharacterized protein n=1 Tax=hydrothermal vent metagenome TaxID=652676 RepID=A0A3B0U316_9ZZZZ